MGNTCTGPTGAPSGFFQTVSAAVWKPRLPPSDTVANDKDKDKENDDASRSFKESSDSEASKTQNAPPSESKTQNTPPAHVTIAPDESPSKKVKDEKTKPVNDAAKQMKRAVSAGLQVASVLQTKSGNLKDFYSIGKKLGQGQFGTTHLCTEKKSGKEFACKSIAKRKLVSKEDVEDVRREIQIMHHLAGHPNVISIVAAHEDAVAVYVVMELCTGGELFDRIVQRGHYSERKAAELARVILNVVEACHSLGVMHRDLKPENFLFVNEEEEAPLKTIDFGLSVFFKPGTLSYMMLTSYMLSMSYIKATVEN